MSFRTILKRGARKAVEAAGGIPAAAHALDLATATVGRWHNRNDVDIPKWDHAFALDEVALIEGRRPEILAAYAHALNHVAIPLPERGVCADALTKAMIDASAEFGDVANALRDATRDGVVCKSEGEVIATQCDEAIETLMQIKMLALPGSVQVLRPVDEREAG